MDLGFIGIAVQHYAAIAAWTAFLWLPLVFLVYFVIRRSWSWKALLVVVGLEVAAIGFTCAMVYLAVESRRLPARDLEETLSEQDVVGTWKLTPASLKLLARDKFVSDPSHLYTVTLRADGTCTYASVSEEAYKKWTYIVMDGTWNLAHFPDAAGVESKRNTVEMDLRRPEFGTTRILPVFRDKQNRLILWKYHGDADGEYLEYSREPMP